MVLPQRRLPTCGLRAVVSLHGSRCDSSTTLLLSSMQCVKSQFEYFFGLCPLFYSLFQASNWPPSFRATMPRLSCALAPHAALSILLPLPPLLPQPARRLMAASRLRLFYSKLIPPIANNLRMTTRQSRRVDCRRIATREISFTVYTTVSPLGKNDDISTVLRLPGSACR
jgi:hypothetical protein